MSNSDVDEENNGDDILHEVEIASVMSCSCLCRLVWRIVILLSDSDVDGKNSGDDILQR